MIDSVGGSNAAVNMSPIDELVANSSSSSKGASDPAESVASKDMFLKLLVAQIKNQDPMNPKDGTEFLGQLAQFTSLEQMLDIRKELESIHEIMSTQQAAATASSDADGP